MSVSVVRWRVAVSGLLVAVMSLTWVPLAAAGPKSVGEEVRLQILAINDFHGQIAPYVSSSGAVSGGAAWLAGYMNVREAEAKTTNTDTWRLGVGDLIGASPAVSGLLQDEPTLEVMDEMGFLYSSVGNHEFDEGIAELLRLQYGGYHEVTGDWDGADMQYLAANVVWEGTNKPVLPPYAIKNVRGVKVGVIGVVYEGTPGIVTASGVAGLDFLDEAETVNRYVQKLKCAGVETIIVMLHNGGAGTTTGGPISGDFVSVVEAMDDEVDVVLSAHSHNRYWGMIDGKLVTQAYSAGRAFADIDLVIDRASGDVVSKTAEIVNVFPDGAPADTEVAAIVDEALATVAPVVNQVIGTASDDIVRTQATSGESELGNLIADGQKWKHGTDIALMNPGGIRADLLAGEVTWGELFAIQPFSNYLVTMRMTGAQLDAILEQQFRPTAKVMLQVSGIQYAWSASAPIGAKVDASSILVNGVPLDPSAVYTVTSNNFLAEGGDGFTAFLAATDKVYWGSDLDALVDYVGQLPQPFNATVEGRITTLP